MKIVIAPDSFKESLPAPQVARAIATGVLRVCPDAQIDICPMADGGEGTVDAMVAATGGEFVTADVFDPSGGKIRAKFGLLGLSSPDPVLPGEVGLTAATVDAEGEGCGGQIAVIEMAAASGLGLIPQDRRDPMRATTFGTGQLIIAAIDAGAKQIVIGIGGSGTTDGGCGYAQALGVNFYDSNGELCIQGIGAAGLGSIKKIEIDGMDKRVRHTLIRVACDVENPLTGPEGAAAVYAPQKGATQEMVAEMDAGLAHLGQIIREQLGIDVEHLPGAGAAGGLGAGLVAFTGASLENGGKIIADAVGLSTRLHGADLCFTGEGKIDSQSRYGKVPVRVAALAGQHGVSTVCIAGIATDDAPRELFRDLVTLVDEQTTSAQAISDPEPMLADRAEAIMRNFIGK